MIPNRVAVLGAGVSGRSAAESLLKRGVEVRLFDEGPGDTEVLLAAGLAAAVTRTRDAATWNEELRAFRPGAAVVSPGIPPTSALLRACREQQIPVWSEVELAWRLQEESPRAARPWFLVTGTNGKTTTVGLLTEILRAGGERAAEVGNVGIPITSQIASDATAFAVEISSFQLETTESVEPEAAICLNIGSDHLDWHRSVENYVAAKARVYRGVRRARYYFAGDTDVERLAAHAPGAEGSELIALNVGAPRRGQIGIESGSIVDRTGNTPREIASLARVPFYVERGSPRALTEDILAAVALALSGGITPESIQRGLAAYRPAAHRQELVRAAGGITWVDDSKATNAHAAWAALETVPDGSAVWVAGGDTKGQDFDVLVREVRPKLRGVVLIGANPEPLRRALHNHLDGTPIVEVRGEGEPSEWMREVVRMADALAQPGDTVMFAPACASWDQFDNYAQRGDTFAEAVRGHLQHGFPVNENGSEPAPA